MKSKGTVQLTQANLEKYGWLFSAKLGIMVREHELGRGKWDVEMDSYTNVNPDDDPRWDSDQKWFDAADNVAALIQANPDLAKVRDWVSGDNVEMF